MVILVYAINNEFTFNEMQDFVETVDEYCPPDCIKVLVGNKCDLENERKVEYADALDQAKIFKVSKFFEASAKKKDTVD